MGSYLGRCFPGKTAEEEEERRLLHLGNDAWDCSSPPLTPGWGGVPTTLSVTPRAADFAAVTSMSPCSLGKLDESLMEQTQRIFEAEVEATTTMMEQYSMPRTTTAAGTGMSTLAWSGSAW